MSYSEIIRKYTPTATVEDMQILTDETNAFIEQMKRKDPEAVEEFLTKLDKDFYFLTDSEAREIVSKFVNESSEVPTGEKWDKATTLQVFKNAGYPTHTDKYSENGVYVALNMVYSDYYPMYEDNVKDYIQHAYLFLNDKDYSGDISKEKWYFRK